MQKILMYCYRGDSWDSAPLKSKAIQDVTHKTQREVAKIADLQQEMMGRSIHIKRITE